MKLFSKIMIVMGVFLFASCIKHEIIPAPEKKVDLPASFSGMLNGSPYELIKDKDGYRCIATQAKEILPSPQPSNVIYYSSIESAQKMDLIKISLGKLNFNPGTDAVPTLNEFKTFFTNNKTPDFMRDGLGGVEIAYRDAQGNVWLSREDSTQPQNFVFSSQKQETDEKGDYMKCVAQFNVTLYDDRDAPTDSIVFMNATYEGYFKR
ncbi:MAG: hypothetical protein H3C31_09985 [Brumimicrobium sp.]|nr:hypothetical protein [Brumimicrobium sp.]MCO5269584.1 hypothetical protein [Brumimicrobium sp.]